MAESKSAMVLRDSRVILTVPVTFTAWLINHLVPESERHTPMLSALNAAIDLLHPGHIDREREGCVNKFS